MVLDIETTRHGTLQIRSIDFHGQAALSPNGQFCLAWEDCDYKGKGTDRSRGGFRESGMGRAVFIAGDALVWQRDLERPNEGGVANTGYSIINDWLFGEGLNGMFYGFSPDGRTVFRHYLRANLDKGGISPDGEVAWCTTLHSSVEEDANKLIVSLLAKPGRVIKIPLPRWKITKVSLVDEVIDVETTHVSYVYSQNVQLLNPDEIEATVEKLALDRGSELDLYALWQIAKEGINIKDIHSATQVELERKIGLLRRIAAKSKAPHYRALAERKLGEVCLALGNKQGAVTHFRSALAINPKVGVKTTLRKLEKQVGR